MEGKSRHEEKHTQIVTLPSSCSAPCFARPNPSGRCYKITINNYFLIKNRFFELSLTETKAWLTSIWQTCPHPVSDSALWFIVSVSITAQWVRNASCALTESLKLTALTICFHWKAMGSLILSHLWMMHCGHHSIPVPGKGNLVVEMSANVHNAHVNLISTLHFLLCWSVTAKYFIV